MHPRAIELRFDLHQTILQFTQTLTHRRKLRADVRGVALRSDGISGHAPRDSVSNNFRLIFHRYKRSIRSTTPTIAESIAAPASPVAAVDALQPSCTISTVSPIP